MGSITLGELEGKLEMLEIKRHRCERHGRVSPARLIDEHEGADTRLPDVGYPLRLIARTRARRRSTIAALSIIRSCRAGFCPHNHNDIDATSTLRLDGNAGS